MMDNNEKKNGFSPEEERRMRARADARAKEREEKQRLENEKRAKRQSALKKSGVIAKIVLIIVVILSLLFIAVSSLGNVTFSKIGDYVKDFISNLQAGDGYPIDLGSGNIDDVFMLGETVALIKNNEVSLLNKTAKETASYPHSYSKPMVSLGAGRILICDRVTGRYMICDRSEVLYSAQLQAETFACAVSKKGRYAFSVNDSKSSSRVSVYDAKYDKLLDFKCADEYIIGLSFSPNGKNLAMVGIGTRNAELYSKLYILNIKEQKITSSFEFAGESLTNVFYSSKDTVIAVGKNSFSVIQDDTIKEKVDFGYNTVSRFDYDSGGNFAIALSKYGSIDSGTVTLYDSTGKEIYTAEVSGKIECLDYDGKTLCIADSDNVVRTYNKKGVLIGESKLQVPAQDVAVKGKYCYALCYGTVNQLDVDTDIK